MTQRKVTTIPATIQKYTAAPIAGGEKRKVAGYARVSTDHEDQATSYEAQVDYYTRYIKEHDNWEFAGIYTDEGISATNTKRREGFKNMVADALAGKIDLIVTKSVSRFARNTVDSLSTIRKLKDNGTEVYFEKENIWTMDAKGELLITIMSSLAQEESRSISENVTWGQRKRFADGKASVAYGRFLGYDRGPNGGFVVNEEQAKTVRLIYALFLEGLTCHSIAEELTNRKLPTPGGQETWNQSTVKSILTNEKYKGDALLQKSFMVDFLQKKMKKNEGEVPQYYVEGDHEAIIEPEVFDFVQTEMERRYTGRGRYSGVSIFSSKIKCGECGGWYGAKVWHSNDKYRRVIYQCNRKYKGEKKCGTPHITEDEAKAVFVRAVNKLLAGKDELISNVRLMIMVLSGNDELEKKRAELQEELEVIVELTNRCVAENARVALDQDEYTKRYNGLVERYETTKAEYDAVEKAIADRAARKKELERFARIIDRQQPLEEFDENIWASLVDFITVYSADDIRVTFRDGTEIKA
ncbi:MAG: recombinase family protein [Clostridiales bacterium]|nr:recombinase family protein [Clostridiales bacterium]